MFSLCSQQFSVLEGEWEEHKPLSNAGKGEASFGHLQRRATTEGWGKAINPQLLSSHLANPSFSCRWNLTACFTPATQPSALKFSGWRHSLLVFLWKTKPARCLFRGDSSHSSKPDSLAGEQPASTATCIPRAASRIWENTTLSFTARGTFNHNAGTTLVKHTCGTAHPAPSVPSQWCQTRKKTEHKEKTSPLTAKDEG